MTRRAYGEREKLPSKLIPQQNRPEKVVRVLEFLGAHGRRPREAELDPPMQLRQIQYSLHAAAILGFVDEHDSLTDIGRLLIMLPQELRLLRLVFAFEASDVGRAWIRHQRVCELNEVDPKSALRFLAACAENADAASTADRRADTIRSWARRFRELREQYGSLFDHIQRQDVLPLPLDVRNVLGKGDSIRILQGYEDRHHSPDEPERVRDCARRPARVS